MAERIGWLRQFRKTATFGMLRVGMALARRTADRSVVETIRYGLLVASRIAWPLRRRLATTMRAAGVYRAGLVDEYFARAVDQLAMLAHVFAAGTFAESGNPERFAFDESFAVLERAYRGGRGVLLIAPHICGYPVFPAVIMPRLPCSIYLRRNPDPRKMRITEAIGRAGGGHLVYPRKGAAKSERLDAAIGVLRQGRILFITPDTPRKPHEGVPVTIFGRTVHFPTGVFVMALRTGAPVVPAWWHWADGAYRIRFSEPIKLRRGRGAAHPRLQAEQAVARWAGDVDAFLHEHPAMWWNWLDKRWTRLIRMGR